MIPKNKIEEACIKSRPKKKLSTGIQYGRDCDTLPKGWKKHDTAFKLGVSFAEKELENLAIEFAEWINWCGWNKLLITDSQNWLHITGDVKTTKELFEIFKKENYETNK